MAFKFGEKSKEKLETCHEDLRKILYGAIRTSPIDFGIAEGHRPLSVQREYYAIGRTKELHRKPITDVDGINKMGKHNKEPSEAVDIYIWHADKATRMKIAYDNVHLSYVMGIIHACAGSLLDQGQITHKVRWGNNWDGDGIIMYDQTLIDACHVEIINPQR